MTEREPPRPRPVAEAVPPPDVTAVHHVLIEIRDELRQLAARRGELAPERPRPPDWIPGVTLYNNPGDEPTAETGSAPIRPPAESPILEATAPANQELTPPPEKRRVVLTGRVGATPAFRTTPKGQTIAQFPLGVHPAPDVTEWHTILAFGERAEQLRGTLTKGEPVEVIGYQHERTIKSRNGQTKLVTEIYATAVLRVQ